MSFTIRWFKTLYTKFDPTLVENLHPKDNEIYNFVEAFNFALFYYISI
jgi:hypothetical protein